MTHFQNEMSEHPFIGFLFTVLLYLTGLISPLLLLQLPIIVMQLFQIIAWSIAIFVGCITIFEWVKKNKWFKTKK